MAETGGGRRAAMTQSTAPETAASPVRQSETQEEQALRVSATVSNNETVELSAQGCVRAPQERKLRSGSLRSAQASPSHRKPPAPQPSPLPSSRVPCPLC